MTSINPISKDLSKFIYQKMQDFNLEAIQMDKEIKSGLVNGLDVGKISPELSMFLLKVEEIKSVVQSAIEGYKQLTSIQL